MDLAHASGFEVLFTVNATDRRADGSWDPGPARALLGRAAERRDPVAGWALGNEPNYFVVNHGGPAPDQLARDTRVFAELVHELAPGSLVLGPAAAYWPTHGEMLPAMEAVLAGAGDQLDVVTWHYYPQQSERCTVHLVRASAERALTDAFLDDVHRHHDTVRHLRDRYAPQAQVWLQETGNAQCGGQPGLSDTVRAGFWWVNELGRVARDGSSAVVRWNLSGASYGLLAEPDLAPNPDWWLGVLWRRTMPEVVLATRVVDARGDDLCSFDAFAHRSADRHRLGLTIVNRRSGPVTLELDGPGTDAPSIRARTLTARDLSDRVWLLDGVELRLEGDGTLPDLDGVALGSSSLAVPPPSITFVAIDR